MLFFSIYDEKMMKLSRKNRSGHQALVAFSARHSSGTKHRSRIFSYSFDLQSCLHKYKRLACRVRGNALEKFSVKFSKNADLDWSKSHEWLCLAVYNSVSKQGRRSFTSLYIITCCIHLPQKFVRTHVPWLCSKVMSKSTHWAVCVYPAELYILRPPTPAEAKST